MMDKGKKEKIRVLQIKYQNAQCILTACVTKTMNPSPEGPV